MLYPFGKKLLFTYSKGVNRTFNYNGSCRKTGVFHVAKIVGLLNSTPEIRFENKLYKKLNELQKKPKKKSDAYIAILHVWDLAAEAVNEMSDLNDKDWNNLFDIDTEGPAPGLISSKTLGWLRFV